MENFLSCTKKYFDKTSSSVLAMPAYTTPILTVLYGCAGVPKGYSEVL